MPADDQDFDALTKQIVAEKLDNELVPRTFAEGPGIVEEVLKQSTTNRCVAAAASLLEICFSFSSMEARITVLNTLICCLALREAQQNGVYENS